MKNTNEDALRMRQPIVLRWSAGWRACRGPASGEARWPCDLSFTERK